ncbi:hypothetical protein N4308_15040, partial [Staphylococcus aureus]|nr:hypothetical protein [Staphylococcus aureus]
VTSKKSQCSVNSESDCALPGENSIAIPVARIIPKTFHKIRRRIIAASLGGVEDGGRLLLRLFSQIQAMIRSKITPHVQNSGK